MLDDLVLGGDLVQRVRGRLEPLLIGQQGVQGRGRGVHRVVVEAGRRVLADRVARPRRDPHAGDGQVDLHVELGERVVEHLAQRGHRAPLHPQRRRAGGAERVGDQAGRLPRPAGLRAVRHCDHLRAGLPTDPDTVSTDRDRVVPSR